MLAFFLSYNIFCMPWQIVILLVKCRSSNILSSALSNHGISLRVSLMGTFLVASLQQGHLRPFITAPFLIGVSLPSLSSAPMAVLATLPWSALSSMTQFIFCLNFTSNISTSFDAQLSFGCPISCFNYSSF